MLRGKRSDPTKQEKLAEVERLMEMLNAFTNPACHWNFAQAFRRGELIEQDQDVAIANILSDLGRLVGQDEFDGPGMYPYRLYLAAVEPITIPEHLFVPMNE